jgi:hypothetical protein
MFFASGGEGEEGGGWTGKVIEILRQMSSWIEEEGQRRLLLDGTVRVIEICREVMYHG